MPRWITALPRVDVYRSPAGEATSNDGLCGRFFASNSPAPFTDSSHRALLLELFETGTGDPLRWSAARVPQASGGAPYSEDGIPLEVALALILRGDWCGLGFMPSYVAG
jgi:hypothetical protein